MSQEDLCFSLLWKRDRCLDRYRTLFVICYDPLLYLLRQHKDIVSFAFADDLCLASLSLPLLFPALSVIDSFSEVSGLGINKSKSFVLPTGDPSQFSSYRDLLLSSPWPDLDIRERGTHLGIVIGRKITLADIWEAPLQKALTRIRTAYPYVKALPLVKRILYVNVFIVSIFSYVGLFFVLPTGLWKTIRSAIAKLVIPFHGSAFTYEALVCAGFFFEIKPALKDVWAFNLSLLAARSPLLSSTCNYFSLPRGNCRTSKLIMAHRDAAAVDFWRGRHAADGTLLPLAKPSSPNIYKCFIEDIYTDQVVSHYGNKFFSFRSASHSVPSSLPPSALFYCISDNLLNISVPSFLVFHHFLFIHNALSTSRRLRHMSNTSIDDVASCFFCNKEQDSVSHMFTCCPVINKARVLFFNKFSFDLSPFLPMPSFVSSLPTTHSSSFPLTRPHLFPSLVCFLSSLVSLASPCVLAPSSVPLSASFLYGVPTSLALPILAFNHAVWQFRRPALAARDCKGSDWVVARIVELATNNILYASNFHKTKSVRSKSISPHDSLTSTIDPGIAICYTDGSAVPNPGPCGAGTSIFLNSPDIVIDAGVSLGHSTNNVAELAALAICLAELIDVFKKRTLSKALIFSDSSYAIKLANSKAKPSSNVNLVFLLRNTLCEAQKLSDRH